MGLIVCGRIMFKFVLSLAFAINIVFVAGIEAQDLSSENLPNSGELIPVPSDLALPTPQLKKVHGVLLGNSNPDSENGEFSPPITLLIHGGAGNLAGLEDSSITQDFYKTALQQALDVGYSVLENNGSAMDAIEATIIEMENSPLFNAGRGAVLTSDGKAELDAAVMDGKNLNAGAVAGVKKIQNPILLARSIMENSDHVMFAREGAEEFAKENGFEFIKNKYFITDRRWRTYKETQAEQKRARKLGKKAELPEAFKYGTVGAVAIDRNGNLAAGTSTGGTNYKRWGRIGDAPIIGAGTFADNRSCAVSSTGVGEYFMRLTIARDICAQVEYGGANVLDAADNVINDRLTSLGGDGGVIVLGKDGSYALVFNTHGMFRGVKQEGGNSYVAIFGE